MMREENWGKLGHIPDCKPHAERALSRCVSVEVQTSGADRVVFQAFGLEFVCFTRGLCPTNDTPCIAINPRRRVRSVARKGVASG